ncbi:MAG: TolC family protein [Gammaproteobacteria bacterium]
MRSRSNRFRVRWMAVLAVAIASHASAQEPIRPLAEVIDEYVRTGLESNLALRNQTLEVERNLAALDAARGRYSPALALDARYTRAEGGREITFPVGSLLNPVYSTLNELLAAQGQPAQFPQIEDQAFSFLREREQDTRITVRQPLYAPAIPAAVSAQRSVFEASQFGRVALARRLKRDITVAYLDWLRATKTVDIVEASATLLRENLRVNESLFRNGKITQDQVLRARAELLEVDQQVREAENLRGESRSFLNFLLNRPLDQPLALADVGGEVSRATADLVSLRAAALANRPEIEQSERAISAAQSQVRIERADLKPTVSFGADGGIQGEEYEFGRGRNFGMISLLLNWQFFDGGTNRAQVRGARAAARQAETRRDEVARQIQLEVQQTLDRLTTTADSLATAEARAEAARAGFRIASRKRDEGVINQVEFIDSRSALTRAELNLNVTVFNLLARQAELDYATAAGTLPLGEM